MQVFQVVKNKIGDADRPQHFSIEQAPEDEKLLSKRNAQLASLGITAIWFEKECFDYVENILRLARNELRYRGVVPVAKKSIVKKKPLVQPKNRGFFGKLFKRLIAVCVNK